MLNAITDMSKNAKASVDFAGLNPPPSGQFLDAIKKGLRDRPPGAPHVLLRFLIGTPPPETPHPGNLFLQLHDTLRSGDDVQIAMMNTNATNFGLQTSWDHSKVLDVDGTTAIVGGTNW